MSASVAPDHGNQLTADQHETYEPTQSKIVGEVVETIVKNLINDAVQQSQQPSDESSHEQQHAGADTSLPNGETTKDASAATTAAEEPTLPSPPSEDVTSLAADQNTASTQSTTDAPEPSSTDTPAASQPPGPRGLGLGLGLGAKPLLPSRTARSQPTPDATSSPTPAPPAEPTPEPAPEPVPQRPKSAGNLVDLAPPSVPLAPPKAVPRLSTLQLLNDQLCSELNLLSSQLCLARALAVLPPADLAAAKQLITLAQVKAKEEGTAAADLELEVGQLLQQAEAQGLKELAATLAEFGDAGAVAYPQLLAEVAAGSGELQAELAPRKGDVDVEDMLAELDGQVKRQAVAEHKVLQQAVQADDLFQVFEPVVLHRKHRRSFLSRLAGAMRLLLAPAILPVALVARAVGLRRPPAKALPPLDPERLEFRIYCARVKAVALYRQKVLRELELLEPANE